MVMLGAMVGDGGIKVVGSSGFCWGAGVGSDGAGEEVFFSMSAPHSSQAAVSMAVRHKVSGTVDDGGLFPRVETLILG